MDEQRKTRTIAVAAAVVLACLALSAGVHLFRTGDALSLFFNNLPLLLLLYFLWKKQSRVAALLFVVLSGIALVKTLREDGSAPFFVAVDCVLNGVILAFAGAALWAALSRPGPRPTAAEWAKAAGLNALSTLYAVGAGLLLLLLLNRCSPRLFLVVQFSRWLSVALIVVGLVVFQCAKRGWMPFTRGFAPEPRWARTAAPKAVRPRFLLDVAVTTLVVAYVGWEFYRGGVFHRWFNLNTDNAAPPPAHDPAFPGCPEGTERVTAWLGGAWERGEACRETGGEKLLNGPFMAWHPENKKALEGAYAHGLKTGPWKQWDAAGTTIVEGAYARDRRTGRWTFQLPPEAPFQKNYDVPLDCAALWGKKRWVVRPGACFGGIGLNTAPGELPALFGEKEAMVQTLPPVGFLRPVSYANLFSESEEQTSVEWGPLGEPLNARVVSPKWTTAGGIRVGLTVADLEKLNGEPIPVSLREGQPVLESFGRGKLAEEGRCLEIDLLKNRRESEEDSDETENRPVAAEEKKTLLVAGFTTYFSPEEKYRNESLRQAFSVLDRDAKRFQPLIDSRFFWLMEKGALSLMEGATGRPKWTVPLDEKSRAVTPVDLNGLGLFLRETSLVALDLESGKTKWAAATDRSAAFLLNDQNAPLVTDGNRVVLWRPAAGGARIKSVSLADGRTAWERTLPAFLLQGTARNLLALTTTTVQSINAGTGALEWTAPLEAEGLRGRWMSDGERWLAPVKDGLRCVSPQGENLWQCNLPVGTVPQTVVAAGPVDLLFCLTRSVTPEDAGRLIALNAGDGKKRWETPGSTNYLQRPRVAGDAVAFLDGEGLLRVLDIDSGRELWRTEGKRKMDLGLPTAPPVFLGEDVVVGEENGQVRRRTLRDGKIRWIFQTGTNAGPLYLGLSRDETRLFVQTIRGDLNVLAADTGQLVSRAELPSRGIVEVPEEEAPLKGVVLGPPLALAEGVGLWRGDRLTGVDFTTGRILWAIDLKPPKAAGPPAK